MASLTGLDSIFNLGSTIIDKIFPDKNEAAKAKIRLIELEQAGAFKEIDAELEIARQQTSINLADAQSGNLFQAGWRPAVAWVCVAAMFNNYIAVPMMIWLAPVWELPVPERLDVAELFPILAAMLGIGGMRSWEKKHKLTK